MKALSEGRHPEPPGNELARGILSLLAAMPASPDLFRAALEYIATVTPVQEILRRRDVAEGIGAAREAMKGMAPAPMPGPNRQQLLELVR